MTFCTAHHSRCSTQKWTKNWAKPAIFGCASEPGQHISAVCSWVWGLGVTVLSEPNCIQVQQKVFRHVRARFECGEAQGFSTFCATVRERGRDAEMQQGRDGGTCVQQIASRSRALVLGSIACMPVCASSNRSRLLAGTRQEAAQSAARENFCLTWTPQPEFIASRQIFRPLNGRFQPR